MKKENRYKNVNYCIKCGSKLKIVKDRENKVRPHCMNCGWTFYKNPVPASACVILNNDHELLVIKRKFAPKAGEWALPSGYVEINQWPEEAAVAEMKEETGLDGKVYRFVDYYLGHSPIYERIISFGFLMKITGGKLKAGDDAEKAEFCKLDNLPDICFESHRHYLKKLELI